MKQVDLKLGYNSLLLNYYPQAKKYGQGKLIRYVTGIYQNKTDIGLFKMYVFKKKVLVFFKNSTNSSSLYILEKNDSIGSFNISPKSLKEALNKSFKSERVRDLKLGKDSVGIRVNDYFLYVGFESSLFEIGKWRFSLKSKFLVSKEQVKKIHNLTNLLNSVIKQQSVLVTKPCAGFSANIFIANFVTLVLTIALVPIFFLFILFKTQFEPLVVFSAIIFGAFYLSLLFKSK